jgi:hypothetical protein
MEFNMLNKIAECEHDEYVVFVVINSSGDIKGNDAKQLQPVDIAATAMDLRAMEEVDGLTLLPTLIQHDSKYVIDKDYCQENWGLSFDALSFGGTLKDVMRSIYIEIRAKLNLGKKPMKVVLYAAEYYAPVLLNGFKEYWGSGLNNRFLDSNFLDFQTLMPESIKINECDDYATMFNFFGFVQSSSALHKLLVMTYFYRYHNIAQSLKGYSNNLCEISLFNAFKLDIQETVKRYNDEVLSDLLKEELELLGV